MGVAQESGSAKICGDADGFDDTGGGSHCSDVGQCA
jgi:hypothetical protein